MSPYVLIMIAAAMICAFIVAFVWFYRRKNSETIPLILLLLGVTEWIAAALMGLVDQDLSHNILWAKIEYIGVVSVPLALLGYVLHHFGFNQKLNLKRWVWLAVIPVITLVLAWTNGNHGLIWAKYIPYLENGLVLSDKIYGPGFWVYWVYSYLVLLVATFITFRSTLGSAKIFRWQSIVVIIAILVPWAGNLLYVLQINPFNNLDLTPLAFSIAGILMATGMFRWRLFDIKPIAHAAVLAGMADGLMILDNQDRIVEVNPSAQAILDLSLGELVGKQMEQVIANLLPLGERSHQTREKTIEIKLTSSKEDRIYELSDSPFYEKQGTFGGRIIFLHDVTDRKRLEQRVIQHTAKLESVNKELKQEIAHRKQTEVALQNAHDELELRVQERTAKLTDANIQLRQEIDERKRAEEALKEHSEHLEMMVEERTQDLRDAQEELVRKEKLATLGELGAGVAHELRNPLGIISNSVYFLKASLTDADDTTVEYLDMISSEISGAVKIVNNLLSLTRREKPKMEETPVAELVTLGLNRQVPPEGVDVTTEISNETLSLFADPSQIVQVMENLLSNAYQSMPDGGELTIKSWEEDSKVCISVADTGCGIPEEYLEEIFKPLFTTKARGIGLGLTISRDLIAMNNGSIEVESIVGQGTTFTLRLPGVS